MTANISGIILENFRSFPQSTKIPLRPITLLYGQNSAGKSTVIKALLLIQQTLASKRRQGIESSSFVFSGDSVDLGSFHATISNHDQNKILRVGVEVTAVASATGSDEVGTIIWSQSDNNSSRSMSLEVTLRGHSLRFERHPQNPRWLLTVDSVPSFLKVAANDATLFAHNDDMIENLKSGLGYLPEFGGDRFPLHLEQNLVPPGTRSHWLSARNFPNHTQNDSDAGFTNSPLVRAWKEICSTYWEPTRSQIRRLAHIGPLRQEPLRFDRYSPTSGTEVGSTGEEMLSLLHEKPNLVIKVNEYLAMMELPYKVKVVALTGAETMGRVIYLALVNRKTGLELSPSDVGVGYSQVLPLIAQSTLARNQLVSIEQPELHLHPAMQARLGDLFISEATGGSQTRFLIETHSESLMLRILRRVREGHVRPEDVQVIYIDQDMSGTSSVHEIPIDMNGDFSAEWPSGFFDERLEELGF